MAEQTTGAQIEPWLREILRCPACRSELRDEKVVLSADFLPAGTYVYTYLARASTAGTFNVIPPTASEFYFPDVGGRGAGSIFEVKP